MLRNNESQLERIQDILSTLQDFAHPDDGPRRSRQEPRFRQLRQQRRREKIDLVLKVRLYFRFHPFTRKTTC